MQTSMKCRLVEKVSLNGAHSCQTKVDHRAERAPGRRDGIGDVGGDFVQVGEKQEHAEAEKERADDRVEAFGGCLPHCHVNLLEPVPWSQGENREVPVGVHAGFGQEKGITGERRSPAGERACA
jgi:hypothetical protein